MGALRSCYSVKAVIRPGHPPTWLRWYFADKCAGVFPFRHSFQTHGQFPKEDIPQAVGEQPGPRPYSKGHGPIGASHDGLTWQGELDWFVNGVPSDAPPAVVVCPTTLVGSYPYPPPSTWSGPEFQSSYTNGDWDGLEGANAGGFLNWYFLELGIDPLDPASIVLVRWHYFEGEGMVLYFGFSADSYSSYPLKNTTFIGVFEDAHTAYWLYRFHDVYGGEYVFNVVMSKCVP